MSTHHKLHPLCSIFPPMSEDEFERLRDDIAKHGQRQPILLFDGQILDGRHRHDACLLLKIEPKFETFHGTFDEAESLVLSLNLARRHLDTSQRSSVAAKVATLPRGSNQHTKEDVTIVTSSLSAAQAAEKLNVSRMQVQRAKYVNEHAAPEVIAEVDAGRMSINKAKKLIAAQPDKGRQALAVKINAVDEMIAAHAAELQAAAAREAADAKPEWLAEPDELERPEETDLPQLPKTNTHHTSANRRTPDARETDRVGLVTIDDPRDYVDGAWYRFDESMGRLFWVTDDAVLERAKEIGQARGLWLVFSDPKPVVEHAVATTPVVGPTKESVSSKPGKVPTLSQLRQTVDAKVDWSDTLKESARDWAAYKMTLAGKDKIRSMESWQKALTRMGNVARDRSVADVCEAIEKAIANGWTGWEHLETSGSRGGSRISTAVRSNRNWDEEIPEWKPTE
jgi:ParB-like chromosome segregation protein Spo0J